MYVCSPDYGVISTTCETKCRAQTEYCYRKALVAKVCLCNGAIVLYSCSWDSDAWGRGEGPGERQSEGRVIHTTADIHPVSNFRNRRNQPGSIEEEEEESRGIYSDIPELPADLPDLPPPDSTVNLIACCCGCFRNCFLFSLHLFPVPVTHLQ